MFDLIFHSIVSKHLKIEISLMKTSMDIPKTRWLKKHATQNCVSCYAEKVLQWNIKYTIRRSSERLFWLVPTPVNPVECLLYYCLTSICMFTSLLPWFLSVYPSQHILFVPLFIMNALWYLWLPWPTYYTYLNSTFY